MFVCFWKRWDSDLWNRYTKPIYGNVDFEDVEDIDEVDNVDDVEVVDDVDDIDDVDNLDYIDDFDDGIKEAAYKFLNS